MWRNGVRWLIGSIAASACVVAACSGDDRPDAGGGGGTTTPFTPTGDASRGRNDVGEGGAAADAGVLVCPVPALGGAVVTATSIKGSPPTDLGGTIAAGTYDLTALELYVETSDEEPDAGDAGVLKDTAQATLQITADALGVSKTASPPAGAAGAPIVTKYTAKQRVSDVFLVIDDTCPDTDSRQIPFTATATTLTLHSAQLRREVYTKR